MSTEINSSIYDDTHTWQNANDRVSWERAFTEGNQARRKEALALVLADRATTDQEIRDQLIIKGTPPRQGYEKNDAPTLDEVLITPPPDPGTYPTDFSGSNGEYSGSSTPTLEWF
jgi:hypothetical protein